MKWFLSEVVLETLYRLRTHTWWLPDRVLFLSWTGGTRNFTECPRSTSANNVKKECSKTFKSHSYIEKYVGNPYLVN